MKRTGLILLLAGALATPFFLGSGFAQGWGGMMGNGYGMMGNGYGMMGGSGNGMMGNGYGMMSGNWSNQNIPEEYQLSKKQQRKIQDIQDSYYKTIQPLQKELQTRQQQYASTLNGDHSDTKTLHSRREAIQSLRDTNGKSNLDARKRITKVLTNDQLAYFGGAQHFLMGMNGYASMMNGNGYTGCFGANSNSQGNQSQAAPRGMMNQN